MFFTRFPFLFWFNLLVLVGLILSAMGLIRLEITVPTGQWLLILYALANVLLCALGVWPRRVAPA